MNQGEAHQDVAGPVPGTRDLSGDEGVAGRLSNLSAAKRAYLERLLEAKPLTPAVVAPLSFAQEQLWFLQQLEPDSAAYTLLHPMRIDQLQPALLQAAVDFVVARHAILRTRFVTDGDTPMQQVAPACHIPVEQVNLTSEPEPVGAYRRLAAALARVCFDLEHGPLLRVVAARLADAEWVILLAIHHIVVDGWSMGVLLRDLNEAYRAALERREPQLAPLPLRYADYAARQRERLSGPRLEAMLNWWRAELGDAPTLSLPADRPRPPVASHRGAHERLFVEGTTAAALRALARTERASFFMCLLAAFGVLLSRWSGQSDLVVGAPSAGRSRAEYEPVLGLFVNTLVMRLRLDGAPTFRELLRRVRSVALGAYEHEDIPFSRLVRELAPARDPGRNPIFQVTFQQIGGDRNDAGLDAAFKLDRPAVAFDVQVDISPRGDGFAVHFAYATDLFNSGTIARMAGHFGMLLRAIAADPDTSIHDFEMLTPAERAQLAGWNETSAPIPDVCMHELVEAQARRSPGAVAVEHAGVAVTYADLVTGADLLAARLAALGAGPDRPVAVLLGHSANLVMAQLGVLKAGAAFMPLDIATPPQRLARILARSRPLALVTMAEHTAFLPAEAPPLVLLDGPEPPVARPPALRLPVPRPDALAYLIATSGTTGTPKIVEVEHRSLVNLVIWHQETYAVTAQDRVSLLAAVSFDASVWEIWPSLAAGATLVVPDEDLRHSPRDVLDWLVCERITLCFAPTPLAEAMLAEPLPDGLRLRALLTGGDVLAAPPTQPLPFPVVNHYGPTECSVVATCTTVGPADPPGVPPPIGTPIRNVQAYVLDAAGQNQPIGVPGELHLAGAALARGYHDDPVATEAAFGPRASVGRLYRTGDRACWGADGRLRFLGRLDDQLKVRGYRVERGEIVAALRSHASVRDAAIARHGDSLAAFIVWREGAQPDIRELRAHLARRLPASFIPASYTMLEELPLTPHGKLDYTALPPPAAMVGTALEGTGTNTERVIAAIFADLLGATSVGPEDDFFDLGGHSLLATRLVARIHASLAVELPVRQVFEGRSVRHLAAAADVARRRRRQEDLPAPQAVQRSFYRATLDASGELVLNDSLRAKLLGGSPPPIDA
jgi:amino acid adenylation domain-containing protein